MRPAFLSAVAVLAGTAPATALAQRTDAPAPATAPRTALTLFVGGGGVFAGSHPGFDRSTGAALVGGAEIARPTHGGLLGRLALRVEGGLAYQDLSVGGAVVEGDVRTAHGALALRVGLGRSGEAARLVPYALAGAVVARPSSRVTLSEAPHSTPGARFEQVSHETVPGALVGAGVAWRVRHASLRAEARWMSLATADRRTTAVPLVLSLAVPLGR